MRDSTVDSLCWLPANNSDHVRGEFSYFYLTKTADQFFLFLTINFHVICMNVIIFEISWFLFEDVENWTRDEKNWSWSDASVGSVK